MAIFFVLEEKTTLDHWSDMSLSFLYSIILYNINFCSLFMIIGIKIWFLRLYWSSDCILRRIRKSDYYLYFVHSRELWNGIWQTSKVGKPLIYIPCIASEDDTKPIKQMQCRLNTEINEVIKVEVLKLLDASIIYPIVDSSGSVQHKLFLKRLE